MSFKFFKEWDFYYIPKSDYSPKWVNYKQNITKFYNNECVSPKGLSSVIEKCYKDGPWYDRCKNCGSGAWAFLAGKNYCWRSVSKCTGDTYQNGALCYNNDSACKPEMITNQNDYHCGSDWNIRDKNVYEVGTTSRCSCTGACYYGAKNVCSYDPKVFETVGGVGATKLIKSVALVCPSNTIYCKELTKAFVVKIQFSKLTSWDLLDRLKTALDTYSDNSYEHISYLNFIAYKIATFYLMMNVENASKFDTEASNFAAYVPLFLVFKKKTDNGIMASTTLTSSKRDYSLNFYVQKPTSSTSLTAFYQYTINKTYATLSGGANPQSNLTFGTIGKQGIFLVKPTQHCVSSLYSYDSMSTYKDGEPIVYLVYYNMNDIKDQSRSNIITELKEKYINNVNITSSPEYLAWNEYVYYNHILPNICYDIETESSKCNEIMNYDASPPTAISQNCSLLTSQRVSDCKTYLMTNISLKQPTANKTRTYSKLDSKQTQFCNDYNTLDCQCYDRESHTAYQSFQNTGYSFPTEMKGNVGCWYKPCMDDPSSNILIESKFRDENLNCAKTVCENVVTVMNRPENTVQFTNLDMRTSCSFLSTRKPSTTISPSTGDETQPPTEEEEENTDTSPPPVPEESQQPLMDEEIQDEEVGTISLKSNYIRIGVAVVVIIGLSFAVISFLKQRMESGLGVLDILLTIIVFILIGIAAYFITTDVKVILAVLK